MKIAGLFAGVGGFELGLEKAGHKTLMLCEIWDPARAVLAAHFTGVEISRDVRSVVLPAETELLAAGFPCQDLSQAGLTAGINGTRSSLVGNVFRLLDQHKVPWVVLENVSFMLHLSKGAALRTLVDALEERGYRWAYRVINSLSYLPQRRERVFLVATNTDSDPADVLLADEATPLLRDTNLFEHAHGFYWTEGTRGLGWAPDAVPTLKNGSTIGIPSPPAILLPTGDVITPDIRDAERLQGFGADWTRAAERVGRPSLRWSLVGNAVSVPVARWLGNRLAAPGCYHRDRDAELRPDGAWPRAARFDGSRRWKVEISGYPAWIGRKHLHDYLKFQGKLLSSRATRGFLARADASTLRFIDGFKDRVRAHLACMESQPIGTSSIRQKSEVSQATA